MTRGWTGFRTAVLALAVLAWNTRDAAADAMSQDNVLQYTTSGAVSTQDVTGANVISFIPVKNAMIDTTSNLSFGYFQVAGLTAGQSTTYNDTPISITLEPSSFNSATLNDTPITITGHLTGKVSGPYQSSVQLTLDPITNATFNVPYGTGKLDLLKNGQELLVPASVNNGQTTIQGHITTASSPSPTPAPEPSTIALFVSMVGGLGLRHLVQKRRQRTAA